MGIFARLKTGWSLAMDSVGVLRKSPSLTLFPLIGGGAGLVYVTLLLGGSYAVVGTEPGPILYGVLFLIYLGSSFISAFFTAALVYNVRETFQGRNPTLGDGLSAAWDRKGMLFAWSLISAIIGVILRAIESSDNPIADVASLIFSVAWGILTYFIIPVIVFEDVSVKSMFKRSGETFKNTWGETAGAGFGVGIITALFVIFGLILAGGVFLLLGTSTTGLIISVAFGVIVMLSVVLIGATLTGIAKTALYVYATEGKRPPEFNNVNFQNARR